MSLILGSLLLVLGAYIAALNWWAGVYPFLFRKPGPSWAPLLGGVLLAVGLHLSFQISLGYAALLGMVLDFGCVPGFALAFFWHMRRVMRSE